MKKLVILSGALLLAGSAFAGEAMVKPSESDSSAALILLAMIGVVIASGSGMFATRGKSNEMIITPEDAEEELK